MSTGRTSIIGIVTKDTSESLFPRYVVYAFLPVRFCWPLLRNLLDQVSRSALWRYNLCRQFGGRPVFCRYGTGRTLFW